jgi:UDP-N-acetylglucosamine:LPS N-acetylglucosamine transferase
VRLLARHWTETRPDMVISLVPHFNRPLCESFGNAFPDRPFVTLLTDLADYPPHFWMERQRQYFICGTERAVAQAHGLGHNDAHVFLTSGMILHPRFYEPVRCDRREERVNLGLAPDLPTGLVLFGGYGSGAMLEITEQLDQSGLSLQLILICGRNEKLVAELRKRRMRIPCFVEGFTTNIPYYMHLSDFFIGKPGPGAISEALVMHLPVIVECNAWTLPQERYNTVWIREKEVGLVLHNLREIQSAAAHLLEPSNLIRFRENTDALHNRAVFEIPDVLEKILHLGNREDEQKLTQNKA